MGPPGSSLALAPGRMHPCRVREMVLGASVSWLEVPRGGHSVGLHSAQGAESDGLWSYAGRASDPLALLLLGTELSTKHQNPLFSWCLRAGSECDSPNLVGQRGRQARATVLDISAEHHSKTRLLYSPACLARSSTLRWHSVQQQVPPLGIKLTRGLFPSVQLLLVQELCASPALWGGLGHGLQALQPLGWYLGL